MSRTEVLVTTPSTLRMEATRFSETLITTWRYGPKDVGSNFHLRADLQCNAGCVPLHVYTDSLIRFLCNSVACQTDFGLRALDSLFMFDRKLDS
jgi:hypothetical protein